MRKEFEVYKKHLDLFTEDVLKDLGYVAVSAGVQTKHVESYVTIFVNNVTKIKMTIDVVAHSDEYFIFPVSMELEKPSKYEGDRQYFLLYQYNKEHGLTAPDEWRPPVDFETHVQKYFEYLKEAFATYLRFQVTGVKYEEHDVTKSFYEMIYQYNRKVLAEEASQTTTKIENSSLLRKLFKIFFR